MPVKATTPATPAVASRGGHVLPVELSTDRWYLTAKTATGHTVRIYLDSAGGMFLTRAAVSRLGLPTEPVTEGGETREAVSFPQLVDTSVPLPPGGKVAVLDESGMENTDGMFGAPWFAGHAFTFDYHAGELILLDRGVPEVPAEHRVTVGFPRDASGAVESPYGRIHMIVDGETIDMLLDTGATTTLTDTALAALGGGPKERATSFITKTVFERWRAKHPDWRVIDKADVTANNAPMIEVPEVTVGGYEVGPVWFTWRPDDAFHKWMAQWMDKPSEGALGGDAYRTLRVSVDWVTGVATFEKP